MGIARVWACLLLLLMCPGPLTTDRDKVGWVPFALEFIALLLPGKSQCGTVPACCVLVAFKHLRLTVTHTALPFVLSYFQTGPLLSHLRGPGCAEDLQAGESGDFQGTFVSLITFPFRKSFLTSESAVHAPDTDQCSYYNNPCLEGVIKVIRVTFIHASRTEANRCGCSFWPWGRLGCSNPCALAGVGNRNNGNKLWRQKWWTVFQDLQYYAVGPASRPPVVDVLLWAVEWALNCSHLECADSPKDASSLTLAHRILFLS